MKSLYLLLLATLILPTHAFAQNPAADDITVKDAFARASVPGRPMGAIFLKLINQGQVEHQLEAVVGDLASAIEIHNHIKVGGMMRMRKMAHVHIKPGQTKALKPGGLHIMLMGLRQPLKEGDYASITLIFEDGSKKTIDVPIKSLAALE